jgi:transposase InsO family protein
LLDDLKKPWQGNVNQSCPTCVSGKLAQKPYPEKPPRVLKKHQMLLAIDYVGPMQVTAREGYTGMAIIVVEPFHLEMAYPLKEKSSQAQLDAVKDCIARLKAYAPSYHVAFVKSDNAAEYASGVFAAFCTKKEIIQEFSTPYSPQQNGKVERGNRVIVEMARSMITCRWITGLTLRASVHQEPLPNHGARWKTPMEALLGSPPDIGNLRVFGCKIQALVPKDRRKKLDAKTRNRIFIGYATGGAYLVQHNGAGETITARTMVFYEDQFLPALDEEEVRISTILDGVQQEPVVSRARRSSLETLEEETEDVVMSPADFEQQLTTPPISTSTVSQWEQLVRIREPVETCVERNRSRPRVSRAEFRSPVNGVWTTRSLT